MIETDKITTKRSIINQQLFSEAYLRELRAGKFPHDTVDVCLQIIREWREAYPVCWLLGISVPKSGSE